MADPHELYDVVDEDDQLISLATSVEILARGQWQRIVHIFLFNCQRQLLLCRRPYNPTKAYSGLWSSSAGGHVECGETYEQAARRELCEELGLEIPLQDSGRFDVVDENGKKIHHLFTGMYNGTGHPSGLECAEARPR